MKPDFALSLSFEGIRLYHRQGDAWAMVGEAPLDAPDLPAALAGLRRAALAHLAEGGARRVTSKVVLPNDQVRYLALDNPRATEAEIAAAVAAATPYALDEVVFDHARGGGRTHIAIVARETLDEAEAFAAENNFGPLSFVAVPEPYTFPGEPFFGPSRLALANIGGEVERDAEALRIVATSVSAPAAAEEDNGQPAAPPVPADAEAEAETLDAGQSESEPAPAAVPAAVEPDAIDDTPTEEPPPPAVATEIAATADAFDPAPPEGRETPLSDPADMAAVDAPPEGQTEPVEALSGSAAEIADPTTAPEAGIAVAEVADPVIESAPVAKTAGETPAPAAPTAEAEETPVAPSDADAAPEDDSPAPVEAAETAPAPVSDSPAPAEVSAVADLAVAAEQAEPEAAADEPHDPPAAEEQAAAAEEDSGPPLVFQSRARPLTASKTAPDLPIRPLGAAAPVEAAEAAFEPVFQRSRPPERREPTLAAPRPAPETAAAVEPPPAAAAEPVIVATPVVAPRNAPVQSAASAPRREPSVQPAPAAPPLRRVAAGLAPTLGGPERGRSLEDIDADVPGPAAPAPGRAARRTAERDRRAAAAAGKEPPRRIRLALLLTLALLAFMALIALWSTTLEGGIAGLFSRGDTPTAVAAAPPSTESAPPAAAAETAATATVEVQIPVAPPGAAVSPEEAERIYAATGVWLRAPRLPIVPRTEDIADLDTGLIDAARAGDDPTALPTGPGMAPDATLPAQPLPPPAGASFDRDERGLIRATPEGVLLPNGATVFAAAPPMSPPTRPGTPPPAAAVVAAAAIAEAGLRPATRPAALEASLAATEDLPADPATAEDGLAAPDEAAAPAPTPGAVSYDGLRPASRPAAVEAAAPRPLPDFDGPAPRLRTAAILARAAAATATPEQAALEEQVGDPPAPANELDAALLAIVAAAPDPLAGVSTLAVPQARRPDDRPQNFARVVSRQNEILARAAAAASAAAAPAPAPAAATQQPAPGSTGTAGLTSEEAAEAEEVVSAPMQPSGATPGGVAQAATVASAINLREMNLIGVFGPQNDRRALVRLANGRIMRVNVGDSLDGGQVMAIGDGFLNLNRRGQTVTLRVPGA